MLIFLLFLRIHVLKNNIFRILQGNNIKRGNYHEKVSTANKIYNENAQNSHNSYEKPNLPTQHMNKIHFTSEISLKQLSKTSLDHSNHLTVKKCVFKRCLTQNGQGSSIYINVPNQLKIRETPEYAIDFSDSEFYEEMENKYAIYCNGNFPSVLFRNNSFQCRPGAYFGGIYIRNIEKVKVADCIFKNIENHMSINYIHDNKNKNFSIIIENCSFIESIYTCCNFDIKTGTIDSISILKCTFTNCQQGNGKSIIVGITENSNSILFTMKNNTIYNCGTSSRDSHILDIKLNRSPDNLDPIIFEENIIKTDDAYKGCNGVTFEQENRDIIVSKCYFSHTFKGGGPFWASTFIASKFSHVLIEECYLDDCGFNDGGNVVAINKEVKKCTIKNTTFHFSQNHNDHCGSAISTFTDNIELISNKFIRCNANTVRIVSNGGDNNQFELIDNYFYGCSLGRLVTIEDSTVFVKPPIIKGNIFDNNKPTYEHLFLFRLKSDIDKLIFDNNTFKDQKSSSGSFGCFIDMLGHQFEYEFLHCYFINNDQSTSGGGFRINDQIKENIKIKMFGCIFEQNKCQGKGGGIFLDTGQEAIFENCVFKDNIAQSEGGAFSISNTKVTISNCEFSSNKANKGQAIYVENTNTQVIINQNTIFNNNLNEDKENFQFMIVLNNINVEILDVEFHCPIQNEKQSFPILFESTTPVEKATFQRVKSFDSSLLVIPSMHIFSVPLSHITFLNCQATNYIVQIYNENFELTDSEIHFEGDSNINSCGGIQILSIGRTSITNTKFIHIKSNDIVNYKHSNKATIDDSLTLSDCLFSSCEGYCFYFDVETESSDTINIYSNTFNDCKRNDKKSIIIGSSSSSDSITLNIDSNKINNCGEKSKDNYLIRLEINKALNGELNFYHNDFHFDDINRACTSFYINQIEKSVIIYNCTFEKNVYADSNLWETTMWIDQLSDLVIEKCTFSDCGTQGNVMVIQRNVMKIRIENCSIIFSSNDVCASGISTYTDNIEIIGNVLKRCNDNSIRIVCKDGDNQLKLIDNYFYECSCGTVIRIADGSSLSKSPIIKGNTFERNQNLQFESIVLVIKPNINEILFENNTFNDIKSSIGGFGCSINNIAKPIELKFTNCYFIYNEQNQYGGGFKCNRNQNDNNFKLNMFECVFEHNIGKEKGGAIFIDVKQEVILEYCVFNDNEAKSSSNTNGEGGSIYITERTIENSQSVSIQNCQFHNNKAMNGFSLFSTNKASLIIDSCSFNDDSFVCSNNCESFVGYDVVLNSLLLLFQNSSIVFQSTDQKLGGLNIKSPGNIRICDSKIENSFSDGNILYGHSQIAQNNDLLMVENCSFKDCKGVCCYLNVHSGSSENITLFQNKFDNCQKDTQNTIVLGINEQINSILLTIRNNTIVNCGSVTPKCHVIYLNFSSAPNNLSPIVFEENIVTFDDAHKSCIGIWFRQENRDIFIHNCTFKYTFKDENNRPWASTIICNAFSNVIVDSCLFDECGYNKGGNVMAFDEIKGKLTVQFCKILFSDNSDSHCGAAISTFSDNAAIIGNEFVKCNENTIRIENNGGDDQFELIDNYFKECSRGYLVTMEKNSFSQSPIVKGNTFENNQGAHKYSLNFILDSKIDHLIFDNNTFNNQKSSIGSFGCFINNLNRQLDLQFINCYFINNDQSSAGSGIRINNNQNNGNNKLKMSGCVFENNKCQGKGGGIFIDAKHEVSLEYCVFNNNEAKSSTNEVGDGGSIYVTESSETNGRSISIQNCQFLNNKAAEDNSIISCMRNELIIHSCNFEFENNKHQKYVFIKLTRLESNIKLENSTFQKNSVEGQLIEDFVLPKILTMKTTNVIINDCTFKDFGNKAIEINNEKSSLDSLQFTNNDISGSNEFLYLTNILTSPKISGNIFHDFQINSFDFIIEIDHNVQEILLEDNTFKVFIRESSTNSGVGLVFRRNDNALFTLIFINCNFHDIENRNENNDHQNGGAFQYGIYDFMRNVNIKFESCQFSMNKCTHGKGGALSVSIDNDLTITDCIFKDNYAPQDGGAIYIDPSSITSAKTTINNCTFENCISPLPINYQEQSTYSIKITNGDADINLCIISFNDYNDNNNACGGIDLGVKKFEIQNCEFYKTNSLGAIRFIQSNDIIESIMINNCIFEDCAGSNTRCFLIKSNSNIEFENNVIQKMKAFGEKGYFGQINFPSETDFIMNNISFIDNECNSLYGGGSGLIFSNSGKIIFKNCTFIRNSAIQISGPEYQRPLDADSNIPYYNGDGGAIQYGYSESIYDIDIEFNGCHFQGNRAVRHGGAIALQTLKTVEIVSCLFEGNVANNLDSTGSELLFSNHFDKKKEGRGGAIYLNPTFSHINQPDDDKEKYMTTVNIENCQFKSNSAFDGFAIYIEGEEAGSVITIKNNEFIDNYNLDFLKEYSAIITSEICYMNLIYEYITENNKFKNEINGKIVLEFSCVDVRGKPRPTKKFTESIAFSDSIFFSKSEKFSNSADFTESNMFSKSLDFSYSEKFSYSIQFSESNKFSNSHDFSYSSLFSESIKFTKSDDFSYSQQFSNSDEFSNSNAFSESGKFSFSSDFTNSVQFSESVRFSESKDFSKSIDFSDSIAFSESGKFSFSSDFTNSVQFSESVRFSESKDFSKSIDFSNSIAFSESGKFSFSKYFSDSKQFSESTDFSKSSEFSNSNAFSETERFSKSEQFSYSDAFSCSDQFSKSADFTESQKFSFSSEFTNSVQFSESARFSESKDFSKSIDFSDSIAFSESGKFSFSEHFSGSKQFSKSIDFSESERFSFSEYFSESKQFSESIDFSKSSEFSYSDAFSKSIDFSNSVGFSESNKFSFTDYFSESQKFSNSGQFSDSIQFSKSNDFSNSLKFSHSIDFSNSDEFSLSFDFTESQKFSFSSDFTKSHQFSDSSQFSFSNQFSESDQFSQTIAFSNSKQFSNSIDFSNSNEFSKTNEFSHSIEFSNSEQFSHTFEFTFSKLFSKSIEFSFSNDFSNSVQFSESNKFSKSTQFSLSSFFSESKKFSQTVYFSESIEFSLTKAFSESHGFTLSNKFIDSIPFSNSIQFTFSNQFTNSVEFSGSTEFSKSIEFTKTDKFSQSNDFSQSEAFSKTNGFSNSIEFSKSVQFSVSSAFSNSKDFSKTVEFSNSNKFDSLAFTKSCEFSNSNKFTNSYEFSRSHQFSQSGQFSHSDCFSQSAAFEQTDAFSIIIGPINSIQSSSEISTQDESPELSDSSPTSLSTANTISNLPIDLTHHFTPLESFSTSSVYIERGPENAASKNKKKTSLIIGIVVGLVALIAIVVILILFFIIKKRKSYGDDIARSNEIDAIMSNNSYISNVQFSNPLYGEDEHASRDPFNEEFMEDSD